MNPVPDPLLLRKSGSAENRTRDLCICSQKLWPLDHRGGLSKDRNQNFVFRVSVHVFCVPRCLSISICNAVLRYRSACSFLHNPSGLHRFSDAYRSIYLDFYCTGFYPNRTKNIENTDKLFFGVWVNFDLYFIDFSTDYRRVLHGSLLYRIMYNLGRRV